MTRLRLFLAMVVAVSHAIMLTGRPDPAQWASKSRFSLGDLAVDIFFALSGFMVSMSWEKDPAGYAWRRVRRIAPAFVLFWLFCLGVEIPLLGRAVMTSEWPALGLQLLTAHEPRIETFPRLNGSMWTIRYELLAYGAVAALGVSGLKRRGFVTGLLAVIGGLWMLGVATHAPVGHQVLRLGFFFIAGIAWRLWGGRLPRSRPDAPDLSYGLYLCAWPISLVAMRMGLRDPGVLAVVTLAVGLPIAAASWFLVERPFLRRTAPILA